MPIKFLAALAAAVLAAVPATALTEFVTNGSFESSNIVSQPGFSGQEFGVDVFNKGYISQSVTGWTAPRVGGISFYFIAADGPSTNAVRNRYNDPLAKLAASYTGPSPDGGNFLGFDSDFVGDGQGGGYNSPFEQSITGLTVGKAYMLSYFWAATQLQNRSGPTTDYMTVTFAGSTRSTPVVTVASQGFTRWTKVTEGFTATSTIDTLSFLAFGTPNGLPPFALLDGVSLTAAAVPEPAAWMLMIAGFGIVGAAARRRRTTVGA